MTSGAEMTEMTIIRCDKIFASAWLDNDRVLAGTKDNQVS